MNRSISKLSVIRHLSRRCPDAQCLPRQKTSSLKKIEEKKKKEEEDVGKKEENRHFFNKHTILPNGVQTEADAKMFAGELQPGERKLIFDALRKITADQYNEHKKVVDVTIHHEDLLKVWYINFIPMFVYGSLDEAFLIIGGESINQLSFKGIHVDKYYLGSCERYQKIVNYQNTKNNISNIVVFSVYNGMSMLASAAVANIICNLFLQLPADRCAEILGFRKPVLSVDQMNTPEYKYAAFGAKLSGLWLGLTLGLLPLFFIDDNMDNRHVNNREFLSGTKSEWYVMADQPNQRKLNANEYCELFIGE